MERHILAPLQGFLLLPSIPGVRFAHPRLLSSAPPGHSLRGIRSGAFAPGRSVRRIRSGAFAERHAARQTDFPPRLSRAYAPGQAEKAWSLR